jgi:hypothetical protein
MMPHRFLFICALLLSFAILLPAKGRSKKQTKPDQDEIEVIAHVPVNDTPVTRFLETRHYRRDYLYAEHASQKNVTLIDVTNPDKPAVLAEIPFPTASSDQLQTVTGNVALVATSNVTADPKAADPQTFRIMSFADPTHPVVKQVFENVSAVGHDDERGLIFLANPEGVWILRQHFAMDPEYVKEWEHMMLDAR